MSSKVFRGVWKWKQGFEWDGEGQNDPHSQESKTNQLKSKQHNTKHPTEGNRGRRGQNAPMPFPNPIHPMHPSGAAMTSSPLNYKVYL